MWYSLTLVVSGKQEQRKLLNSFLATLLVLDRLGIYHHFGNFFFFFNILHPNILIIMKAQLVFVVSILGLFVISQAQDISFLLQDKTLVEREINCVLGQGPCDAIGKQIVALLPEVLNNGCNRCTPQQALNARKLIEFMQQRYPSQWQIIVQRYTHH